MTGDSKVTLDEYDSDGDDLAERLDTLESVVTNLAGAVEDMADVQETLVDDLTDDDADTVDAEPAIDTRGFSKSVRHPWHYTLK